MSLNKNRTALWMNPFTWAAIVLLVFVSYLLGIHHRFTLLLLQLFSLAFLVSSYRIGYRRRQQASGPEGSSEVPDVLRVAGAYDIGISMIAIWSNLTIAVLLLRG